MTNKLLAATLLILVTAIAVVLYDKYRQGEEEGFTEVSFICENGNNFVARFDTNFQNLSIIENGNTVRELNSIPDMMIHFGNQEFDYIFVGEEVRVYNLTNQEETVCRQPFDPNNAPYNFGDSEEPPAETPDPAIIIRDNILGVWQSTDDENFTREFRDGNVVIDSYTGSEDTEAVFDIFTANPEADYPFPLEEGRVYLVMMTSENREDDLYFEVTNLTPTELDLIYLNRGGVLQFTRVE